MSEDFPGSAGSTALFRCTRARGWGRAHRHL